MTNIVLLALSLLTTNTTGKCACTSSGVWASDYCWQVGLTYSAPVGVYQVLFTYTPEGATPMPNGWKGMNWTPLNQANPGNNLAQTFYTNTTGTNRITFTLPVPPWDAAFFRLKKI